MTFQNLCACVLLKNMYRGSWKMVEGGGSWLSGDEEGECGGSGSLKFLPREKETANEEGLWGEGEAGGALKNKLVSWELGVGEAELNQMQ